ncbi:hypothetical protein B0H14DRAFT_3138632 [Mycena olivaceomarginata]|nr:hypothetical protein B0H14DRAFT_3138632 [Mycena olivaceomarginata]
MRVPVEARGAHCLRVVRALPARGSVIAADVAGAGDGTLARSVLRIGGAARFERRTVRRWTCGGGRGGDNRGAGDGERLLPRVLHTQGGGACRVDDAPGVRGSGRVLSVGGALGAQGRNKSGAGDGERPLRAAHAGGGEGGAKEYGRRRRRRQYTAEEPRPGGAGRSWGSRRRGAEREGVAETAERVCGEFQVVGRIARCRGAVDGPPRAASGTPGRCARRMLCSREAGIDGSVRRGTTLHEMSVKKLPVLRDAPQIHPSNGLLSSAGRGPASRQMKAKEWDWESRFRGIAGRAIERRGSPDRRGSDGGRRHVVPDERVGPRARWGGKAGA